MNDWRKLADEAVEKIELAQTYFEDGAPRGAARCLRKAAALLERSADARDEALDKELEQLVRSGGTR